MSTDTPKSLETPASAEDQTPSGWDPFTVWRERVHTPRAKKSTVRTRVSAELPLAVLEPVKQGS